MKVLLIPLLMTVAFHSARADEVAPSSAQIAGDAADQIASIAALDRGTTGESVFATGEVDVSCMLWTPLGQVDQSGPRHYDCSLAKSVDITGKDADQIASLSFLSFGTTGSSTIASGTVEVDCVRMTPPDASGQAGSQHYSCTLSEPRRVKWFF